MNNFKHIYIDMDGTIADLYNIKGWLSALRDEKKGLFLKAKPIITEEVLFEYFPNDAFDRLWIVTMAPIDCSDDYKIQVFDEKDEWLNKYFPHILNRVFLNHQDHKNIYKSLKHKREDVLLVDDSDKLRETFEGTAIFPPWIK